MNELTPTVNMHLQPVRANRNVWADIMNNNLTIIDAVVGAFFNVQNLQGVWQNSTAYTIGQTVVDATSSVVYQCQLAHTSSAVPTTFLQDRVAHASYWTVYSSPARARGQWQPNTNYALNDFVVNSTQYAVCIETHTSGLSFTTDTAAGKWSILVDLSQVGSQVLPVPFPADANKFVGVNGTGVGYTLFDAASARTNFGATSIGSALITATSESAARVAIGAQAIGDYQSHSAVLDTIIASATAIGLALIVAADAAAARLLLKVYEYDIRAFGADPAASATDNKTAIQAMINAQIADDGHVILRVSKGEFILSTLLDFTGAISVSIYGSGAGSSALIWNSATGGLYVPFSTPDSTRMNRQCLTVTNISLLTTFAGGGTGIDVSCATAVGDTTLGAVISGVNIGTQNNNDPTYWTYGIKFTNMRQPHVTDCCIWNSFNAATWLTGTANVYCTGGTVGARFTNVDMGEANTGLLIDHECEGIYCQGVTIVFVNYGVNWSATAPYTGTDFTFIGGHISSFIVGMFFDRVAHGFIDNNLLIKRDESTVNYADIRFNKNNGIWKITNNMFELSGTGGTEDGIQLDILSNGGVDEVEIAGNTFANRDKAVWIGNAGPTNVNVHDNKFNTITVVVGVQNDSPTGKGIRIWNNRGPDKPNVLANTATPSADNSVDGFFYTSNAGPVTITAINDGYHGQRITLIALNANTTIQHNAVINLSSGVNFAMGTGAACALMYDAVVPTWREIARRG